MQHQNRGIIGNIAQSPVAFAATFVVIFMIAFVFLAAADALPEPRAIEGSAITSSETPVEAPAATPEYPNRITIATLGLDVHINNPESTSVEALDEALLSGAVRYPTSAKLNQDGTVLLFGHSSYLPVIHNPAYKAFKGIQNLKAGDVIVVYSATREYRYAVQGVSVADASQDVIELAQNGKHLTLVTCDTFSKKTSRFIVTADFIGAYPLISQ